MLIEVMYCPTAKKLVRGQNVRWEERLDGMIKIEADCPLHQGEKLTKVKYPVDPSFDTMNDPNIGFELPDVQLPAEPGTPKEPSNIFWEVFTKTVGMKLKLVDRPRYLEISTVVWENKLTEAEKREMLDRFSKTGKIEEPKVPEESQWGMEPGVRVNPDEPPSTSEAQEWKVLNEAIDTKQFIYDRLIEDLSDVDNEAAIQTKFDIPTVARIVGDDEYFSLIQKRANLLKRYDPDPDAENLVGRI